MNEHELAALAALGLSAPLAAQAQHALATQAATPLRLMRLSRVDRDQLQVHDGLQTHTAQVPPALTRQLEADRDPLAVGDWLLLQPPVGSPPAPWRVLERLAPASRLARRDPQGRRHAVANNIDTALLVMGLDADFNPRRLERFMALLQGSGVAPVVLLSKADLVPDARQLYLRLQQVRQRLAPATPVLSLDGLDADSARRLAPWLGPGQTVVLLGSSGAGKSTLANTLLGAPLQDTGPVRLRDQRGQHTTTARQLHPLSGGACLIDTPGLRALRPDADEAGLAASFEDIARLAPQCRFRNCSHRDEPGCGVRALVDEDRLDNYRRLLREVRRDQQGWLGRRELLAEWKARSRASRERLRHKHGDAS